VRPDAVNSDPTRLSGSKHQNLNDAFEAIVRMILWAAISRTCYWQVWKLQGRGDDHGQLDRPSGHAQSLRRPRRTTCTRLRSRLPPRDRSRRHLRWRKSGRVGHRQPQLPIAGVWPIQKRRAADCQTVYQLGFDVVGGGSQLDLNKTQFHHTAEEFGDAIPGGVGRGVLLFELWPPGTGHELAVPWTPIRCGRRIRISDG